MTDVSCIFAQLVHNIIVYFLNIIQHCGTIYHQSIDDNLTLCFENMQIHISVSSKNDTSFSMHDKSMAI